MKIHRSLHLLAVPLTFLVTSSLPAVPFTYQGKLDQGGSPASGVYDFRFILWDDAALGAQVGATLTADDITVTDGLFIVDLDFGSVFTGSTLWLEIGVKADAETSYTALSPRQPLYPAAQAAYSATAPWSGVSGIPADIADGDDDTTYTAGSGIVQTGGEFSIDFAGNGSATTVAHSDHDHMGQSWIDSNGQIWFGNLGAVLQLGGSEDTGLRSNAKYLGVLGLSSDSEQNRITGGVVGRTLAYSFNSAGVVADNESNGLLAPEMPDLILDGSPWDNGNGVIFARSGDMLLRAFGDIVADLGTGVLESSFIIRNLADAEVFEVGYLGDAILAGNMDIGGNTLVSGTTTLQGNFVAQSDGTVQGTLTANNGLITGTTPGDGLFIFQAGSYASSGTSGTENGIEIRSAANDGLMVGANGGDGVDVWNAGGHGLYVRNAGSHGLRIQNSTLNGIDIDNVGDYGIHISDSAADNYFAGDTGIGTSAPTNRLHVRESISASASTANHVALIENSSSAGSGDVLVLKIWEAANDIGAGNNYITFHDTSGVSLGSIQGNGAGGVEFAGPGNDYAEYLPKRNPAEIIQPGEIVGVFQGKVSKTTAGADFLLVASTGAIVAGNDPGEENRDDYVLAAFIGQADLRVVGPVEAGDLIIPSGMDDGTGIAIPPEHFDIALAGQIVGQAWDSDASPGIKHVRSLVGLVQPSVLARSFRSLDARLRKIEAALASD